MEVQPSSGAAPPTIRPLSTADWRELLRLNAANQPAVASLNEAELAQLLEFGGCHLVAVSERGEVLGYLLTFLHTSRYDDTEIAWLRGHVASPFLYICQVVVASGHRRHRIGQAFYEAAEKEARRQGALLVCCDVNTDPPNPDSFAFHHRMGFAPIGSGHASNGFAIAYLAKTL